MKSIEDMKTILVDGTIEEFLDALNQYDINSKDSFGNNILHYYIKLCANSAPPKTTAEWKRMIAALLGAGISLEEKQTKGTT